MQLNVKKPYIRDIYLAYLIDGAKRTEPDGYPIIEKWMVAKDPPKEVFQLDRRYDVKNPEISGMSFYCVDEKLIPILNNPDRYIDKLSKYWCVLGMDVSPYDNMPLVVQKSQIYDNLAITYFYGKNGIKIIPNVRIGVADTLSSLEAYPKNTLISIGTNGFTHNLVNRKILREQVKIVIDTLSSIGILVYGPASEYIFEEAIRRKIPIYQYNSYTMNRNRLLKKQKNGGGK